MTHAQALANLDVALLDLRGSVERTRRAIWHPSIGSPSRATIEAMCEEAERYGASRGAAPVPVEFDARMKSAAAEVARVAPREAADAVTRESVLITLVVDDVRSAAQRLEQSAPDSRRSTPMVGRFAR